MFWLKICGWILASLLVASSFAHSLGGWPALRTGLEQAGVARGSEVWNDAGAGWIFGSICMFVFGVIFASTTWSVGKGRVNVVPIAAIGIGYLAFGIGGCLLIHVGGHIIAFAILGLILLIWAIAARRACCPRNEVRE